MSIVYRVTVPNGHTEFRTLADAEAWRDAFAPGQPIVERTIDPPTPEPHRVSKDTMLVRVEAAGKVAEVMGLIAALPPDEQFLFSNFAWFWSDNARIRAMCSVVGLDPDVILAEDEFA
jgi:hypothetical protein